ncbi:asparagine synthase (glutamine-hydrolyzing) [Candidatus Woesearchaeota archaeon]|nr:asparagine synthase (glutamine-hydrolyzing) [Candidatus Woesearchaeota archaeon]
MGFNWEDRRLAKKLGDLIKHRGPDGEGFYTDSGVTLGHRRLSIIDLSEKGKQPMSNEDKSIWMTYNGEIFNFQEIKEGLIAKGHKFESKTDTEVIIHGYEEYGFKILDKLNGQFVFCLYDKKKKILFIARDRIGINPLYYYFDGKKFIFGSELKVILKSGVEKKINKFALNYYLMYGHTPRKQSIIENAYKLEPSHYMVFNLKKNTIAKYQKYWDIRITSKIKNEKPAKKLILQRFEESVKKRLIADVPVGAFLSGGLDSSSVVAFISKYKKNLNTFSIRFDYEGFDESKYANIVSKKFKTKHHEIKFTAEDVRKLIPKLVFHYDEPFGDPSMIPTYLVSKVARQHVTVSLSGDGGDELFGGYNSYKQYRLLNLQKYYPKFLNKLMCKLLKNFNSEFLILPKAFFELGCLKRSQKFARLMSYLDINEFENITGEKPYKYYKEYAKEFKREHFLNEASDIDLHNYIAEDILTKVDRASMANSLESRPPILDHKMIELACSIDSRFKLKGKEGKWILKKAFEGILPKKIIYRKKKGFGVPLKYYFRNELKKLVERYVINFDKHSLFDYKNYSKEIKKNLNKKHWAKDYSRIIWTIMMFNLWWEKWIKE